MSTGPRETPGTTTRLVLGHVHRFAGEEGLARLLRDAKVDHDVSELRDDRSWFCREDGLRLFDAAAELLGDANLGRHVGEGVFVTGDGARDTFAALGEPAVVVRALVANAGVYFPVADVEVGDIDATSASVSFRLHEGHDPHRQECGFIIGLLSQIPTVFGLPAATVTHPVCAVRGDDCCRYDIAWLPISKPRRLPFRSRKSTRSLSARFLELEADSPELVHDGDVEQTLERVAARAVDALGAIGHVVVLDDGSTARSALFDRAMSSLVDDGSNKHLVAEVASPARHYGHIIVLFEDGHEAVPEEATILRAHARQAVIALDAAAAIEAAKVREETASVLLDLARSLADLTSVADVGTRIAERIAAVTSCDRAAVWLWDADARRLRVGGLAGFAEEEIRQVGATELDGDEIDGLPVAVDDAPVIVSRAECRGYVAHAAEEWDASWLAFVPVRIRGRLRAVIACTWGDSARRPPVDLLRERLHAVADQAATALENAFLLEQVQHQAMHDSLTGLPNQTLFADRVTTELVRARRNRTRVAVGVLDLDRFKTVNDSLGHSAGDALLVQVTERLGGVVRAPDTIARMGGDEFTLLLPEVTEGGEAIVAERILEAFVQPFEVDGHRLRVSPSIGIAVYPADGEGSEELLRCADVAMYRAKDRGRNTWALYARGMAERAYDRLTLESDLYRALQRRELRVDYQPVARPDGTFVGVEALVRWAHPTLGMLVPEEFLPIAEDLGLMAEIDGWVLRQACLELGSVADTVGDEAYVAVNLSARTLCHPALDRLVADALAAGGLAPERLVIEVNESATAERGSAVAEAMRSLRARGVRIALDDFGRGTSALSRLAALPIDQLKVDASFFSTIEEADARAPVVAAIVAMGHGLALEVVAEGVETEAQRAFAERLGVDLVQGWHVGRPSAQGYEGARSRTA
ncbi:MAG TPA: EAL domain-containing protein [Acidimicrobiales bacterium]|nr:EAL domain-containing protein [Acidimicrobiales bacterium]